jgi:predicted RNase H-related nuclease YkuK (DUF458 family)
MKLTFKRLADGREVDLVSYVKSKLEEDSNIKIYVGSDSQNVGAKTVYATVVVLHYGNNGGHVIYSKISLPRVRDTFTRLWNEVIYSLETAEEMYNNGLPRADYIDLDYNPDPIYQSNSVLRSALGYVESMGYKARTKPNAPAASCCADAICH